MSKKPPQSKTDSRADLDHDADRHPDPVRPWLNTRPRGNPEPDDHDVERGLERLTALVGR